MMIPRCMFALLGVLMMMFGACPRADGQMSGWQDGAKWRVPGSESLDGAELFSYAGEAFDFDPGIRSPEDFLGHAIGERFTRHHQMIGYLEYLAEASDRVKMREYGRSYQGRELVLLFISAPENMARLDDIQADNAALSDPRTLTAGERARIIASNPAIVWLSYNVHGNEPSCTETAIQLAYTLAAARDERVREWLDNTVVIIDPNLNPDGRERYLVFYDTNVGLRPDATTWSSEHEEPWPGGRSNHYFFDLNRDWVWGVHVESHARVSVLRTWKPQLHIDYHEQGFRSPHFFGAGDTPYHAAIPQATRDWLDVYGKANAERFDELGLPYFTKERFDYMYPGYGKVLPVYHGAVGMLTEQAGHSRGGLIIELDERNKLTLFERVRNHFVTSVSNIETTAAERAEQLERFADFFAESMEVGEGWPAAFVVSADNDPAKLKMLHDLCVLHGIEIHRLREEARLASAFDYASPEPHADVLAPAGSWLIRSGQPMGLLVRALFTAGAPLEDVDTYDITAWALPATWGLRCWAVPAGVDGEAVLVESFDWPGPVRPHIGASAWSPAGERTPAAMIVPSDQYLFPRAVAFASGHGVFASFSGKPMTLEGTVYPPGSLLVYRVRNDDDSIQRFQSALHATGLRWGFAFTSFHDAGVSLSSDEHRRMVAPRVALVRGEGISSLSYGHLWHLLDRHMPFPHHQVNAGSLSRSVLDDVNVVVLPESSAWGRIMSSTQREALVDWVRRGGTLVAIGSSGLWASEEVLDLDPDDRIAPPADQAGEELVEEETERVPLIQLSFDERAARSVEDRVPGALLRVRFDTTHPLAFGLEPWAGVIRRSSRTLPLSESGFAVARIDGAAPVIDGYLSERNAERMKSQAWMTHHRLGSGKVICIADDPALRGFTHAAARAFMNALVYGPSF